MMKPPTHSIPQTQTLSFSKIPMATTRISPPWKCVLQLITLFSLVIACGGNSHERTNQKVDVVYMGHLPPKAHFSAKAQHISKLQATLGSQVIRPPHAGIPVFDVDGNPLLSNTKYYIPDLNPSDGGGGLGLSIRDCRYPCPPNVVQANDQANFGLSLAIFPADKSFSRIFQNEDVNIESMGYTTCVQPTVWRLGETDPFTGRRYVRSAGELGRPGAAQTLTNWFKIDESSGGGKGYKIVYRPSMCHSCSGCGDVGVFVENGRRWLGVGGEPLVIAFKKLV